MGPYPPRVSRDLDVGPRGYSCSTLWDGRCRMMVAMQTEGARGLFPRDNQRVEGGHVEWIVCSGLAEKATFMQSVCCLDSRRI